MPPVKPIHEKYEELVVEFSEDGGETWARNCVIMGAEVSRTTSVSESEVVQDCADESLPNINLVSAQALSVTVSGTGNWTQGGYNKLLAKFYAGDSQTLLARIGNLGAAPGEIEYEQGPVVITSLGQSRTKGQVVTASVELRFSETPTLIVKPAVAS